MVFKEFCNISAYVTHLAEPQLMHDFDKLWVIVEFPKKTLKVFEIIWSLSYGNISTFTPFPMNLKLHNELMTYETLNG